MSDAKPTKGRKQPTTKARIAPISGKERVALEAEANRNFLGARAGKTWRTSAKKKPKPTIFIDDKPASMAEVRGFWPPSSRRLSPLRRQRQFNRYFNQNRNRRSRRIRLRRQRSSFR